MSMALKVIQAFEHLRNLRVKEQNKKDLLKGQAASAPLVPTVEMLEDLHERIAVLEREQDKRGIVVPDPSQALVAFVLSGDVAASQVAASIIVQRVFGRVMHEVKKLKDESAGEVRAAVSQGNAEWKSTATGAHEALEKLEQQLLTLLGRR